MLILPEVQRKEWLCTLLTAEWMMDEVMMDEGRMKGEGRMNAGMMEDEKNAPKG